MKVANAPRWLLGPLLAAACGSGHVRAQQLGCVETIGTVDPNDPAVQSEYGFDVAIDAGTAVIGSRDTSFAGAESGAVYVMRRVGPTWSQEAKLKGLDTASLDQLGYSVAIRGDTLLAAAPFDDDFGNASGSVYVFRRQGTTWSQEAKLLPLVGAPLDFFGWSVAIDGDIAVVGAPSGDGVTTDCGVACVFERSGATWTQTAVLKLPDGEAIDKFGQSVAVLGGRIAVGAPGDGTGSIATGSVSLFEQVGGVWTMVARMRPLGTANAKFAENIALDPQRVYAGGPEETHLATHGGSVWVFAQNAGIWVQEARIEPSTVANNDHFGADVAIVGDVLVIGAWGMDVANSDAGAAFVYEHTPQGWFPRALLSGVLSPFASLGWSVAFDGQTVLAGAWLDDAYGSNSGSVWSYRVSAAPRTYCTSRINSQGCSPYIDFAGTPSASGASSFVIVAHDLINQRNGVMLYSTHGSAANPFGTGIMCLQPPTHSTVVMSTGGSTNTTDCSGHLAVDFSDLAAHVNDPALVDGANVWIQFWSRDPAVPSTLNLSNALQFTLCE